MRLSNPNIVGVLSTPANADGAVCNFSGVKAALASSLILIPVSSIALRTASFCASSEYLLIAFCAASEPLVLRLNAPMPPPRTPAVPTAAIVSSTSHVTLSERIAASIAAVSAAVKPANLVVYATFPICAALPAKPRPPVAKAKAHVAGSRMLVPILTAAPFHPY